MVCDRCHQNPALVKVQFNSNGQVRVQHLCKACAEMVKGAPNIGLATLLSGMVGIPTQPRVSLTCDKCGLTDQKLAATGRVGCAHCYTVFAAMLAPYIKQIHGNAEHVGRVPKQHTPSPNYRRQQLQQEMQQAIETQNYEEAARLRDLLKAMEVSP